MIRGITVTLYETTATGSDPFGAPIVTEQAVEVDNVLVGEPTTEEMLASTQLYGKEIKAETDPAKQAEVRAEKKAEYEELFNNPYQAAQKGYIEDVIEPRNTRFRVIRALESLQNKRQEIPAKKHDNLPL